MEILLTPKLDATAVADELRKVEDTQYRQSKQMYDMQKQGQTILAQKVQLEAKINQIYTQRLRLISQIDSKNSSMMAKMKAYAQMPRNTMQAMSAAGQYAHTAGGVTGAAALGAGIGAGGRGRGAGPFAGNWGPNVGESMTQKQMAAEERSAVYQTIRSGFGARNIPGFWGAFGSSAAAGFGGRALAPAWKQAKGAIASKLGGGMGGALGLGTMGYQAFSQAGNAYEGGQNLMMKAGDYQRFSAASERSGMGSIEGIYGKYQSAREKALGGDLTAKRSFGAYGVGTGDLQNAQQGFEKLMQAIARTPQTLVTAKGAMEIFGDAANKVVNNIAKFQSVFAGITGMSTETIQQLVQIKDTFSTTIKEIAMGLGWFIGKLAPLANLFNKGKGLIAGGATYAGAIVGGSTSKEAASMANQAYKKYVGANTINPTGTPKTDIQAAAQMTFQPPMEHHINLNRFQRMGMFIGGEPLMQLNQAGPLKAIAKSSEQTAKNTAVVAKGFGG